MPLVSARKVREDYQRLYVLRAFSEKFIENGLGPMPSQVLDDAVLVDLYRILKSRR